MEKTLSQRCNGLTQMKDEVSNKLKQIKKDSTVHGDKLQQETSQRTFETGAIDDNDEEAAR